jgi:hypothetical protein
MALAFLCGLLGGCTQTVTKLAAEAPVNWTAERGKRVVLVDPDVELSELTIGGVTEPRADWTRTGKDFIRADIADVLARKSITAVASEELTDPHEIQLVRLHGAVGTAIMANAILNLPTKGKNLDWTLGPGVSAIRDHYGSDYALFVYVRDSYSTASRAALIATMAIVGVGVPGGLQVGFASLVDLRTGKIVWFNRLASSSGSLKEAKPAATTVNNLLNGLPL